MSEKAIRDCEVSNRTTSGLRWVILTRQIPMLEARMAFDLEQFIADCRAAAAADPTHKGVREVVARAVSEPAAVLARLGEPSCGMIEKLYRGDDLTVLNVIWPPHFTIMPHNHRMWAVIGVYTGREDNIFWRRLPEGDRVEAAAAKSLSLRDAEPLGRDIIHSVTNPIPRCSGAIHVYGGDFFAMERSEWDPETLVERRYDVDKNMRLFEEANTALARA
jgi:predicted metal-dependent enzyme (double-stranded beta helix superfamily)